MTKPIVAPPCLPYRVLVKGDCLSADDAVRKHLGRLYWSESGYHPAHGDTLFTVYLTGTNEQNVAALNRWFADAHHAPPYRHGTLLFWRKP